jgi:hypothetical protein
MSYTYDLSFAGIRLRILAPRPVQLPENFSAFLSHRSAEDKPGCIPDCIPDWIIEVIFGTEQVHYSDSDSVKVFPHGDGDSFWRVVPADRDRVCRLFVPRGLEEKFCVNANWALFLMVDKLLLPLNRVILHASAVIRNGEAILFTAPSGTGKSTQASLWERHLGAEIINGDKVIISADGEHPTAYGGPIAGTSRIFRNIGAPIRAIVCLRQGKTNHAELLDQRHAFMALYSQAVKSEDEAGFNEALIPLIERIVATVPVVDYFCQPNASAVEYLRDRLNHIPH